MRVLELESIFFCFDCDRGINADMNIVRNDGDPVVQVSIKDVSA